MVSQDRRPNEGATGAKVHGVGVWCFESSFFPGTEETQVKILISLGVTFGNGRLKKRTVQSTLSQYTGQN